MQQYLARLLATVTITIIVSSETLASSSDAHERSPMIHLAVVESQRVAFHLMIPEGSPDVLRGVLLHAAHFNARDTGRWYRFCAEHGLAHMTLTEFPKGNRRPRRIGNGIAIALKQFAEQLGRPELKLIPILATGFSAGGMGDPAMRKNLPERYLGCANSCSWMVDWEKLDAESRNIPGLFIIGAVPDNFKMLPMIDQRYCPAIQAELPYTLGLMHGCAHDYGNSATLAIPYLEALLNLRLPKQERAVDQPVPLRAVDFSSGWRGDDATVHGNYPSIAPVLEYAGKPEDAVWLPDRATAYVWQAWQTKDSPIDITVTVNGTQRHSKFVPKKAPTIYTAQGDDITLGIHLRDPNIQPTKIVFWDADKVLSPASKDNTHTLQSGPGVMQVYAEYEADGVKAVTNPITIVVDDPATAERTAKAQAEKAVATAERKLNKTERVIQRLSSQLEGTRQAIDAGTKSDQEIGKLKKKLDSTRKSLQDQHHAKEAALSQLKEAQDTRDAVYKRYQ